MGRRQLGLAFTAAALVAITAVTAGAATIVIVNGDGAGEGFNDPTAVAPVGGNPGVTRGQQRLNVFNRAATIWGQILPSNVTIRVQASFDALSCTPTSGVLGSAGANDVSANFAGAPFANTWYHAALANKIAGVDLSGNDDIGAQFNSAVDTDPNCLTGADWYYGYDGNEGTNIDLLPVVLHELGHGLGFSTFTNVSTGAPLAGQTDVFARFLLDTTTSKRWNIMTNAERIASAVNTNNLVWDGSVVKAAAPGILGPRPEMVVNAPGAIAGTYALGTAAFGGPLSGVGLTGNVVLAVDGAAPVNDACTALVNGAAVNGKIALIDRGTCTFTAKALAAQNAGAIAAIIVNNVAGATPPGLGGSDPSVTIPVVSITQADGTAMKNQLNALVTVNVTLKLNFNRLAGADDQGRVRMFAPNPVQPGSSVSHWDVSTTPNTLMEPAINSDLGAGNVDLTRYLFQDIGWFKGATEAENVAPQVTRLVGNYPNPFNPTTVIRFELETSGTASLAVYDLAGRLIQVLERGSMTAGPHALTWNGTDAKGRPVAAGVYIVRLDAGGHSASHRMVLVK